MSWKNKLVELGDTFYYHKLGDELRGIQSVLDLGCSSWSPLSKIDKNFYSIGVDIFRPSIEKIKKTGSHDAYKVCDVLEIDKHFKKKSFDAVLALDLIEHLDKDNGWKLLEKMESLAAKKVIILTPNGYYGQKPYENNPYQLHKSGWSATDFLKKGYRVHGMRGFKFIRGELAGIKYRPWFVWGTISALSQYLLFYFPTISYQLWAIKQFKV